MVEYDPEREERMYREPFSARHPLLYITINILVTTAIAAIQLWFWTWVMGFRTLWPLILSITGTVLICYWWYKREQKKIEYPTAYTKSKKKKRATPAPDTMTEDEIKKRIRKSKRIQDFLKKRRDEDSE